VPGDDQQPTLSELTELFRELGAPDPESWARSQFQEGIRQLARFSFLKAAWRGVVQEGDVDWIEQEVDRYQKDANGVAAGAGRALSRLLDSGASADNLTQLVRRMQWQTLFHVCGTIDDCGHDYHNPWRPDEHWHLVLHEDLEKCQFTNADVGGLHESVLELDPTGREMRPRPES
jgi:hypothetical protein